MFIDIESITVPGTVGFSNEFSLQKARNVFLEKFSVLIVHRNCFTLAWLAFIIFFAGQSYFVIFLVSDS